MRINKREQILIALCLILVPGILFWSLMNPAGSATAKATQVPLEEAEKQTTDAKKKLHAMFADQADLEPRVAQVTYSSHLTAEQVVPRVIRQLQQIATKSGVHLREIKPLRPRVLPSGGATRVPLEVHFRAAFQPDVVKFLYYVEDPESKMVLDKLNITSADAKFKAVDVSAQITVFTRSTAGVGSTEGGDTTDGNDKNNKI